MSLAIALNVLMVVALVLAFAFSGSILGPKPKHLGDADLPYETGVRPIAPASEHMSVLYYRFAVLFVIFDVDLVFLLPWAMDRSGADFQKMVSVSVFTLLLGFMLAYFWRKGVLECR